MKKVYVLVPLAALLVFGGFYWQHHRSHLARLAEVKRLEEIARDAKRAAEQAAREQAHAAAIAAAEQRKAAREEREREEAERKQARALAETRRTQAAAEEQRLRTKLERLQPQVATLEAAVKRSGERKRELEQEQVFLTHYVKAAEENRQSFYQLLEQLQRVELSRPVAPPPVSAPRS